MGYSKSVFPSILLDRELRMYAMIEFYFVLTLFAFVPEFTPSPG